MIASFNDEDTLILCVVPANTPSLMADSAIGKALSLGKLNKTVLCLTKCDQITDNDTFQRCVIDRVRPFVNKEIIDCGLESLAGVVATAHLNNPDPEQERTFFESSFTDPTPKGQYLKENLMKERLLSSNVGRLLVLLFGNHLTSQWRPNVITVIEELIRSQKNQLALLGTDPNQLSPSVILEEVFSKLDLQLIMDAVFQSTKDVLVSARPGAEILSQPKYTCANPPLVQAVNYHKRFLQNIVQVAKICCGGPGKTELRDRLIKAICVRIGEVFEQQENKTLMIGRFENIKQCLFDIIERLILDIKQIELDNQFFEACCVNATVQSSTRLFSYGELWDSLEAEIVMAVSVRVDKVMEDLKPEVAAKESIKEEKDKLMEERSNIAEKRQQFIRNLEQLHQDSQKILKRE
jgi:hypothetical protein